MGRQRLQARQSLLRTPSLRSPRIRIRIIRIRIRIIRIRIRIRRHLAYVRVAVAVVLAIRQTASVPEEGRRLHLVHFPGEVHPHVCAVYVRSADNLVPPRVIIGEFSRRFRHYCLFCAVVLILLVVFFFRQPTSMINDERLVV